MEPSALAVAELTSRHLRIIELTGKKTKTLHITLFFFLHLAMMGIFKSQGSTVTRVLFFIP